jgi:hypothetical protein
MKLLNKYIILFLKRYTRLKMQIIFIFNQRSWNTNLKDCNIILRTHLSPTS